MFWLQSSKREAYLQDGKGIFMPTNSIQSKGKVSRSLLVLRLKLECSFVALNGLIPSALQAELVPTFNKCVCAVSRRSLGR
jgi:hypothetical protein